MASASEAAQLADVTLALQLRDVATLAWLTRGATNSVAVCEAGCKALFDLWSRGFSPTSEETQHAVEALVSALHAHPLSGAVQEHGSYGLLIWCTTSADASVVACECGAIEAVVTILRTHVENADVSAWVCLLCSTLLTGCDSPETCGRFHDTGALSAVLNVMRMHPTSEKVHTGGCMLLKNLCKLSDVAAVPAAAQLGAPAVIIDTLRAFPDNCSLQESALYALAAMLSAEPNIDDDAHHAGAVSCAVHALQAHAGDAGVLKSACAVLHRLVVDQPVNAAEAWHLGAFPLLMNNAEVHLMQFDVCGPCLSVARHLIPVASSAGPAHVQSEADVKAAVRATLAVVRSHPAQEHLQVDACSFVCRLMCIRCSDGSLVCPRLVVAAAEAGAMDVMVHALRALINSPIEHIPGALSTFQLLATFARTHRHRAHAAEANIVLVTIMTANAGDAVVQMQAADVLCRLCRDDPDACAQAARCGAVKSLCDAICSHAGVHKTLWYALKALDVMVSTSASAAAEAAAAGAAGIGVVAQLLLSSTPQQDDKVLQHACSVLARVTAHDAAAVSSFDAVLPLLHVLTMCSAVQLDTARCVWASLLAVMQSSEAHMAEAAKRGAGPAVDAIARAHATDAEVQRCATEIRTLLTRVEEQAAAAAASARDAAERRAAAMADALIAEEEAARAAPQAAAVRKRPKKKRGSSSKAAVAEGATAADEDASYASEPENASAEAAAALSTLALDAAEPSAAAARRRRRAATKAARRLAQRGRAAGAGEPTGDAGMTEDEADEGTAAADVAAEAVQSAAAPPPQPHAAATPSPPPPPPPPPPPMKECCVCLLDMPATEQMVLAPCGHRCMCEACWRTQLLPRTPAARLCPICDGQVEWAGRMPGLFDA